MNTERPDNRGDSPAEQLGESLHHALWRRNRGRLLWVSVTLGIVGVSILARSDPRSLGQAARDVKTTLPADQNSGVPAERADFNVN